MKYYLTITALATALTTSFSAAAQTAGAGGAGVAGATGAASTSSTVGTSGNNIGMSNTTNTSSLMNSGGTSPRNNTLTGNSSWNSQNSYWRTNYASRPYYNKSRNYSDYEPAYRYGVDLYTQNRGKRYEELNQSQLNTGWANAHGNSNLDWSDAQLATRDAYNRMYDSNTNTSANAAPSR